jgi:hypothetical protein
MDTSLRPRPVFGTASALLAVLAFLIPVVVFLAFSASGAAADRHPEVPENALAPLATLLLGVVVGAVVAAAASVGGVVAGVIGLARHERCPWLSVVGLFVCGPLLTLLIWCFLSR